MNSVLDGRVLRSFVQVSVLAFNSPNLQSGHNMASDCADDQGGGDCDCPGGGGDGGGDDD